MCEFQVPSVGQNVVGEKADSSILAQPSRLEFLVKLNFHWKDIGAQTMQRYRIKPYTKILEEKIH